MKFDLLDAMSFLKKEFGNDSHLTIYNDTFGVRVRLTVYKDVFHNVEFAITTNEMVDEYVGTMGRRFHGAVQDLKLRLEHHEKLSNEESSYG